MNAPEDLFRIATPFGIATADFPEAGGCILGGDPDAVTHFLEVLRGCTDSLGASITPDSLEPATLVEFCQPPGSRVNILPPLDWTS